MAVVGQDIILARSPYYLSIGEQSGGTLTSATLTLNLGKGNRTGGAPTSLKTYTLTSTNVIDDYITVDISPLLIDYLDRDSNFYDEIQGVFGDDTEGNDQEMILVKAQWSVTDTSGTANSTAEYYMACEGYSRYSDGANYLPTTDADPTGLYFGGETATDLTKFNNKTIMVTNCYRQLSTNSYGMIPFYLGMLDYDNDQSPDGDNQDMVTRFRIVFGNNSLTEDNPAEVSGITTYDYSEVIPNQDLRGTTQKAYAYFPIGYKNLSSYTVAQYGYANNDYLTVQHALYISDNTGVTDFTANIENVDDNEPIRYEIICEPKHKVVDMFFVNKYGFWDCFTFLKAYKEEYEVTSDSFTKSVGGIASGAYTYDKFEPQIKRYNVKTRKKYRINTGFVDESFSLLLEEILATPQAFIVVDDVRIPVNVVDNSVELRQHVHDKVINYTLELEAANYHLNNAV